MTLTIPIWLIWICGAIFALRAVLWTWAHRRWVRHVAGFAAFLALEPLLWRRGWIRKHPIYAFWRFVLIPLDWLFRIPPPSYDLNWYDDWYKAWGNGWLLTFDAQALARLRRHPGRPRWAKAYGHSDDEPADDEPTTDSGKPLATAEKP